MRGFRAKLPRDPSRFPPERQGGRENRGGVAELELEQGKVVWRGLEWAKPFDLCAAPAGSGFGPKNGMNAPYTYMRPAVIRPGKTGKPALGEKQRQVGH